MLLLDISDFFEFENGLALRLLVDLISLIILIRGIYYKTYQRSDLYLTFVLFNIIIFFISHILNQVQMSTGAAFGLFAVFSMLRYRTEGISAKDMTYLFLSIALGLITAVSKAASFDLVLICFIMLIITYLMESNWFGKRESAKTILYDSIQNIHSAKEKELIDDLKNRTGLNIHRFEINEIDFLKDSCRITIFYYEN